MQRSQVRPFLSVGSSQDGDETRTNSLLMLCNTRPQIYKHAACQGNLKIFTLDIIVNQTEFRS